MPRSSREASPPASATTRFSSATRSGVPSAKPPEQRRPPAVTAALPPGSYQHLDVSFEGERLLFAYCEVSSPPRDTIAGEHGRYYRLYAVGADGAGLRRLTDGAFDDFEDEEAIQ